MTIAIDFDGTIIENVKYPALRYKFKPHAKQVLTRLAKHHKLVLCSARYGWYMIYGILFIKYHKLPIHIHFGKPVADVYIDDKNLDSEKIDWLEIEKKIKTLSKTC